MGLVFQSKYVEQIGGYAVVEAIKKCIARVEKNQADAACQRWFGSASVDFKKKLKGDLNKLRSVINLQSIQVGFRDRMELDVTENAAALPGSVSSIVPNSFKSGSTRDYNGRHVLLNLNFNNLPNYLPKVGGQIDASDYNQSKFNTLVHELTHVILATNDEKLASGHTAYGAKQALQLVGEDAALAYTNAENWGIFVEACGVNSAT